MIITINLKIHKNLNLGPNINIWINNNVVKKMINIQQNNLSLDLEINDYSLKKNNVLLIDHYGKNPNNIDISDGDIAVEVEEIWFEKLKLHKNLMFEQLFFPNWEFGEVDNIIHNNCYIGFNGVWQLIFPEDPFSWITDYIETEMFKSDAKKADDVSSDKIENFNDFKKDFM